MKNKELSVVDIGTFCLITKRYEEQIKEAGIKNVDSNFFLSECARSISEQLKIMDDCQQMLWAYGSDTTNAEQLLKAKIMFEEGLNTLQSVLRTFETITGNRQNESLKQLGGNLSGEQTGIEIM